MDPSCPGLHGRLSMIPFFCQRRPCMTEHPVSHPLRYLVVLLLLWIGGASAAPAAAHPGQALVLRRATSCPADVDASALKSGCPGEGLSICAHGSVVSRLID